MTDKQIIIDGVDVSGCPYYIHKDGSCSSHDCECVKCVHNVCFYKDYKVKEQECEKWKAKLEQQKGYTINYKSYSIEKRMELEKQLTQLKAILTQIKEIAEKQCVCGVDCIDMKQILQKISEVD